MSITFEGKEGAKSFDEGLYGSINENRIVKQNKDLKNFFPVAEQFHPSTRTMYNFRAGAFESDFDSKDAVEKHMERVANDLLPAEVESKTMTTEVIESTNSTMNLSCTGMSCLRSGLRRCKLIPSFHQWIRIS